MKRQTNNVMLAVLATGIMAFSGVLIETAMNVTFPSLMDEFSITTHDVQWVTTIYLLMIAITVPISGFLIKNFSAKKLFIAANLLFLAGVILNYLAVNFMMLLGGRLLQGIATGIALPLMFHIILSEAPLKQRGLMMGLGTFATSIAPAIGPTYGGFLTTHMTWHYIYFFLIPLLLISLGLGLKTFINVEPQKTGGFDFLNFVLLAGFFISFLCGLSFLTSWRGPVLLVIGVVFFLAYLKHNKKTSQPLLNFDLLKNSIFTRLLILFLVYQFVLLGISFIIPNFIQIVLGKTSATAGLSMLPGAAIGALFSPISGRLLDRIGPQKPLLIGVIVALAGLISLSISLFFSLGIPWLIFSHVLFQIGTGFSYSNSITTAMNYLQKSEANDGNSLFNTLQQFTGAVATAIVAALIGFFQQHNGSFAIGTQLGAFASGVLLAVLMFVGVLCLFSVYKKIGAGR